MGYSTYFTGEIAIDPPLNLKEYNELKKFCKERHGDRLNAYKGFPSMYCDWEPTVEGDAIVSNETEKFYEADEWMKYLIENFLGEKHTLNGTIQAQGEEGADRWDLIVRDNKVFVQDYEFTVSDEREI